MMGRKLAFGLNALLLVLVAGCNTSSISDQLSSDPLSGESTLSTPITSSASMDSTNSEQSSEEVTSTTSTIPPSSTSINPSTLTTAELTYLSTGTYYGNTNGNANNHGLAVYDSTNKLHYYALGSIVYQYNPATLATEPLFTLADEGAVRNLCLTKTDLYFVSTTSDFLLKYSFAAQTITTISENKTTYLNRYDNYIHPNMSKLVYEEVVTGLGVFRHLTQDFLSNFSGGATNVNLSGTKILFTANNKPLIQVMSNNLSGKSTVKSLAELGIVEVLDMQLISETYGTGTPRVFALHVRVSSENRLYLYSTATDSLTLIATGPDITSINSNGTHLFFINNRELYQTAIATESTIKLSSLTSDAQHLYVINHWLYFSNDALTGLYRIHPDTLEIGNLNLV